jgi:hypothetical protein
MKLVTKAAILFVCALSCALGLFFSRGENAQKAAPETRLLPVNNPQPHRGPGLRV